MEAKASLRKYDQSEVLLAFFICAQHQAKSMGHHQLSAIQMPVLFSIYTKPNAYSAWLGVRHLHSEGTDEQKMPILYTKCCVRSWTQI